MNQQFDVFVSFRNTDASGQQTRDSQLAREVYEYLTPRGLTVFLSTVSLEALGVAAFKRAIDDTLESARVLVAVGTSAANLDSQWVRYEWDGFLNDMLSGRKKDGRIFSYLEGMSIAELPRGLRGQQALLHGADSLQSLYNFVAHSLNASEIGWLLSCQSEIARLNTGVPVDAHAGLPASLQGTVLLAYVCVIRHWNNGSLTMDPQPLRGLIQSESGAPMSDHDWGELLPLMIGLKSSRGFGVLLRTPDRSKLAINYPALSTLWESLGPTAAQLLGSSVALTPPRDPKEEAWCDWLRALAAKEPSKAPEKPTESTSSPEEVFPEIERASLTRDVNTLARLPPAVRGELGSHLKGKISEYRKSLGKIKDAPGNASAYLYLGELFYWDLLRIAAAGTLEEASIRYEPGDHEAVTGHMAISEYFLKKYLDRAPSDHPGRGSATTLLEFCESVRKDRKTGPK